MKCPYYEGVNEATALWKIKGYCTGYPAHGLMIPSILEEKRYCSKINGYFHCPIYRFRQMKEQGSGEKPMELCFTLL